MYAPGSTDESRSAAPSSFPPPTGEPWAQTPQYGYSPVPATPAPRRSGPKAIALSVAGVVLAGAAYAGWTIWRQDRADDLAQTITDQVLGDDSDSDVFSLTVGQCLSALPTGGTVSDVPVVDCAQPHEYEVYFSTALPDSAYPGETALIGAADAQCLAAFEPFAGIDYAQSELFYSYLYPTQQSWEAADDRTVTCVVFDSAATTTTGTLAGAAR